MDMRRVSELVRNRLDELHIFQRELARRLDLDETLLSRHLSSERPIPTEAAPQWCSALELTGARADDLTLAIHLASATELLRSLVDEQRRDLAGARRLIAFYEQHIATIDSLVDDLTRLRGLSDVPPAPAHPDDPPSAALTPQR